MVLLVVVAVLACAAANPIYYFEEPLSRAEFNQEIEQLKKSISDLAKSKDQIHVRYYEDHEGQEVDQWEDDAAELKSQLISSLGKIDQLEERIKRLEEPKKALARTCEEIRYFDPSKPSGDYLVDPDGFTGDDAIRVYCNMTTGSTLVHHDAENPTELDVCLGRECQQKEVNYEATTRQMLALMRESYECVQKFQFKLDCPDVFEMSEASKWLDRNGNSQFYSNCTMQAIEGSQCHWSCRLYSKLYDLPVVKMNVGRNSYAVKPYDMGPGAFWLGKLECSGRFRGNVVPQSSPDDNTLDTLRGLVGTADSTDYKEVEGHETSSKDVELQNDNANEPKCPNNIGWKTACHQTATGCYCFVENRQTWHESVNYCKAHGMHLVSVESQEEQNQLNKLLTNYGSHYWWTSGSNQNGGQWMWMSNGRPFDFTNWHLDQQTEHFVQLERSGADFFVWNAYKGSDFDYSICEYDA